jgi:CHAD domain-containing protein
MRKAILTTAAILALSLAAASQAQDRVRDHARYPEIVQMDRVAAIAREIESTADQIHRQAERNNRRPDSAEETALVNLHELSAAARHFRRQAESYRQDPNHTADDFQALLDRFYATADALNDISRRPYIDSGMSRIYRLMDELTPMYGRFGEYRDWGTHHGRDRYDRDHDHDHGH